jgi:hypothetical protein
MPAGRPRKYTKKLLKEIEEKIIAYTDNTPVPILAECAYELGMHRRQMYEFPELNHAIKRLITKKESVLEKGALSGKLNTSMAIFSLKQLGWSDKQEVNHSGAIEANSKIELYLPENGRDSQ